MLIYAPPRSKEFFASGDGHRLDYSNPLTEGLILYAPLGEGRKHDLVNGIYPTSTVEPDNDHETSLGSMMSPAASTSMGYIYDLTNVANQMTTRGFTFNAWFYPNSVGRSYEYLARLVSGASTVFRFSRESTQSSWWRYQDSSGTFNSATGWPTNRFVNLCLCYDETASQWQIYLDGLLWRSGSRNASMFDPTALYVGRHTGTGYSFNAPMGRVGLWDRALKAEEIAALYADANVLLAPREYFARVSAVAPSGTTVGNGLTAGLKLNRTRLAA